MAERVDTGADASPRCGPLEALLLCSDVSSAATDPERLVTASMVIVSCFYLSAELTCNYATKVAVIESEIQAGILRGNVDICFKPRSVVGFLSTWTVLEVCFGNICLQLPAHVTCTNA